MSERQSYSTERLNIRHLEPSDASFILELVNSPGWLQFIGDRQIHDEAAALRYLEEGPLKSYAQYGFGLWCVERRDLGLPIGMVGLLKRTYLDFPDLGYALLPAHEGLGFATEAAQMVVQLARHTYQIPQLLAITTRHNLRSIAVLHKLGFQFERMIAIPPEAESLRLFQLLLS